MMARSRDVAERLLWLFDVVAAPVRDSVGRTGWHRYTEDELAEHIAAALGEDQAASREAVERARTGGTVRHDQLVAIASFFDVDPAFFDTDRGRVDAIRDTTLGRALRDCGVGAYLICRMALSRAERHTQLRTALRELRRPVSTNSRWHDAEKPREPQHDGGPMRDPMTETQLHELCRDLVNKLGLRAPFEPPQLCERLGVRRGRRIQIRATDLGGTTGVGHLAPTRRGDRIFVEHTAPAPQQALVIYHEVIHLVLGHLELGESVTCGLGSDQASAGDYADWREWEAEVGARALAALARQRPLPNQLVGPGPENAIAAAFGFAEAP